MTVPVDEVTVRQHIKIISEHALQAINGAGPPGVLQLCRLNPIDESIVPSRFTLDDVENMVKTAVGDALAGHNAYIEARTVRADLLQGNISSACARKSSAPTTKTRAEWCWWLLLRREHRPGAHRQPLHRRQRRPQRQRRHQHPQQLQPTSCRPSASSMDSFRASSQRLNTR